VSDDEVYSETRIGITEDEDPEGIAEETQYVLASFALSPDDGTEESAASLDPPTANFELNAASSKRRDLFIECIEDLREENFGGRSDFSQGQRWVDRRLPRWARARNDELAYDLAVDAMMATCEEYDERDGGIDRVGAYFQGTLEKMWKQYLRDNKKREDPFDRFADPPEPEEPGIDDELTARRLKKCMQKLDDRTAEQLSLFIMFGEDYDLLAEHYEITKGTAYARISRARDQVRTRCSELR
jgi:RNA polymerase sigma factor (sigma-70 family)